MEIVRRGWNKVSSGNGSLVSDCIRACRKELSKWKRSEDCNTKKCILQIRRDVEVEIAKHRPNSDQMLELKVELEKTYREEETYWKEKSKNTWLQDGD